MILFLEKNSRFKNHRTKKRIIKMYYKLLSFNSLAPVMGSNFKVPKILRKDITKKVKYLRFLGLS